MSTSRDSRIGLPLSSDSRTASSRERSWMIRAMRNRYLPRSAGGGGGAGARRARVAGGGHRAVHVGRARFGHLGQDLLGGGRDGLERAAVLAGGELPVDEQPVGLVDMRDRAGFGRGGVLELWHVSPARSSRGRSRGRGQAWAA